VSRGHGNEVLGQSQNLVAPLPLCAVAESSGGVEPKRTILENHGRTKMKIINSWAENQNWAKLCPGIGIITLALLFLLSNVKEPIFWALINIPLYLFHQTEEHYVPGGFKDFMNHVVFGLPEDQEKLTDIKIFWINILLVWVAFAIFGSLAFVNIGFGLVIIIFSIMNCMLHIVQGIKLRRWNPGLVVASIQFVVSIYAAYFLTMHVLSHTAIWWASSIIFSILVHVVLFNIMKQTH